MNNIFKGAISGFVATIALSLLMMIKSKMGVMPAFDVIAMLAGLAGGVVAIGWLLHFSIGTAYGVIFSFIHPFLPSKCFIQKGLMLGVIGWLAMMLLFMPFVGQGLFAMKLGMMVVVMTLVLHLIFGVVLGLTYKKLS